MAPKLSEEDIDDVLYFSRVGENDDLSECLTALAERENVSQAEILLEAKNEGKSTALHMATGNGHLGTLRLILFSDHEMAKNASVRPALRLMFPLTPSQRQYEGFCNASKADQRTKRRRISMKRMSMETPGCTGLRLAVISRS